MNLQDLHKVWEIKALKKPGDDESRRILDRIAKQVQPIMRRREWRVKLLSEFCPSNPTLLGLNVGGGVEVKLRLRRPKRDWDFFPFEQVLDTMLHELCHIQHGPHNAQFYKLWDELRVECEELVSKGITGTGQGFDARGQRLGGFTRQPPLSSLRQAAAAAAVKRARNGALLPSGPRRLGGDSEIMTALSPIQAAAMAAERRMQDDLWCGSGWHESFSAPESEHGKSEHSTSVGCGESSKGSNVSRGPCNHDNDQSGSIVGSVNTSVLGNRAGEISISSGSSSCGRIGDAENKVIWECNICTLFNQFEYVVLPQPLALKCEACGTQKLKSAASKFKIWTCKFCTLENDSELEKCSACDRWRYSYGAPVSTRAPNCCT
ncbi:uncharacterized protein LOC109851528 isoform X1 [Asparagus officinalis]|uniref:uncharacterized protein LOC109851528 isoform X1 n=1 Tax=Asparagus officinalis TaxID=4686 RepID=UPI00098E71E9|nr:uncharacterized protein LOC109851528 isoform X1 [Asparagus officinalis]XP_020277300.1 uncharacterized protein LOC109851528 isoform X1 [Asparagus officinalis]